MPHSTGRRGGIFISYRREDTAPYAGRLFDRLRDHFGDQRVFMDVDSIRLGRDYSEAIDNAVGSSDALIALIGDHWLTITDDAGRRRIDNSNDLLRLEIETALRRGIPIIPVLVNTATIPREEDLPPSIKPLARRQALRISHDRFRSDVTLLLEELEDMVSGQGAMPATTSRKQWRAEVMHSSRLRRSIRISSGEESHLITIRLRSGGSDLLELDGKVIKKGNVSNTTHEFLIHGRDTDSAVIMKVKPAFFPGMRITSLEVSGQQIYKE
jgi:hypothetical protein